MRLKQTATRFGVVGLFVGLLVGTFVPPLPAAEIVIKDPKWGEITKEDRNKAIEDLRSKGVLKQEDTIVYEGPESPFQDRMDPGAIADLAQGIVCAALRVFGRGC